MSQTRRLAAILAADVAGYSRLMGTDEEGSLERLKALRREPWRSFLRRPYRNSAATMMFVQTCASPTSRMCADIRPRRAADEVGDDVSVE
jgi:hypothetical protein